MSGKALFIAPSAYTLGGTITWLDYLLPGLSRRGWRITLGLTGGRFHDVDAYLAAHPFSPTLRVDAPTGTREGRVRALARTVRRNDPDVVVVLNVVDAYEAVARARGENGAGARVVATLHGLQPDFLEDFRALGRHLDAVICSNRLARALVARSAGLPEERVGYAPYGVEMPDAPAARAAGRRGTLRVAWCGRLEGHQKRVMDLPGILAGARRAGLEVSLRVAGAGPEEGRLRQALDAAGVAGCVNFLGVLDARGVRERLYRESDVLLLTSSWETGPIVAWEAMSEGLALLSSDYLGRRAEGALADGGNCLLFPVGDENAAVAGLVRLADPDLRQRLASAGLALVAQRYSREHSVDAWHRQLQAVMAMPPRAPAPPPPPRRSPGRLDAVLGATAGEHLRRLLGRRYVHAEAGAEWPHSRGNRPVDDAGFWSWARAVDARCDGPGEDTR